MESNFVVVVAGPEGSYLQEISGFFKEESQAIDFAEKCNFEVRQVQILTIDEEEEVEGPDIIFGVRTSHLIMLGMASSEEEAYEALSFAQIQVRLATSTDEKQMMECGEHGLVEHCKVVITDKVLWFRKPTPA